MKKEILCTECAGEARQLFPNDRPYPGENVRFVYGKARDQYHCDWCMKSIHPGDLACAFTIFVDGETPEWETEYLASAS